MIPMLQKRICARYMYSLQKQTKSNRTQKEKSPKGISMLIIHATINNNAQNSFN